MVCRKRVLMVIVVCLTIISLSFVVFSQTTITGFSVHQPTDGEYLENLRLKTKVGCLQNSQCSDGFECVENECVDRGDIDICKKVKLSSPTRKLKYGDSINSIKEVLTDWDLPYLLSEVY